MILKLKRCYVVMHNDFVVKKFDDTMDGYDEALDFMCEYIRSNQLTEYDDIRIEHRNGDE